MQILCITNCFESNTCNEYEAGQKYDLDPKFIKEHSMEKYFEIPVETEKPVKAVKKTEKTEPVESKETTE